MHQIIHIYLLGCCQVAAPRRRRISRTSCLRHRNARSTLLSMRFLDIAPFWSHWISQPAPYHINQIQNAMKRILWPRVCFGRSYFKLPIDVGAFEILSADMWTQIKTKSDFFTSLKILVSQWFTSYAVCTWSPSCFGWCQMPETNNGCSGGSVYSVLDSALFAWNRSAGWVKAKVWDSWDWKENFEKFQVGSVSLFTAKCILP